MTCDVGFVAGEGWLEYRFCPADDWTGSCMQAAQNTKELGSNGEVFSVKWNELKHEQTWVKYIDIMSKTKMLKNLKKAKNVDIILRKTLEVWHKVRD